MNHDQFVESIMRCGGMTKANVSRFYAGLVELARRELARNKHFVLPGLGSFRVRTRKARMGRNPRTGELMRIAPRKVVRFHAFGRLREIINAAAETAGVGGAVEMPERRSASPVSQAGAEASR